MKERGASAPHDASWGTFDLALHEWDEPAETLLTTAQTIGARVLTPIIGRPFEPAHIERPSAWWREVRPHPHILPAPAGISR